MARRRDLEDSVMVSIDRVRDMIRGEVQPPPVAKPVPMARPVPPEAVAGVPSFAEVSARREARWGSDAIGQVPVIRVAPKVRWRAPLVAAAVGALVAVGAVFAVHAAEGDPAPFAAAAADYGDAVDNAVLSAKLASISADAEANRVARDALRADVVSLEAELAAARAETVKARALVTTPVAKTAKKTNKKSRVRRRSTTRTKAKKRKTRRRPKKKLTGADHKLDSLIQGL